MAWDVQRVRGTVGELHEMSAAVVSAPVAGRLVRVCEPLDRAVVLGSAQPVATVDQDACDDAGAEVVRRRSGGGAVLVQAGELVWVDLVLPSSDPLWQADVGQAGWWVGEAWVRALCKAGLAGLEVYKGPMLRREWSALVCFAGLAGGEVTGPGGPKVVGISQRRSRTGSLFQCACLLRWEPSELVALLRLAPPERARATAELTGAAFGAGQHLGEEILANLVQTLP